MKHEDFGNDDDDDDDEEKEEEVCGCLIMRNWSVG